MLRVQDCSISNATRSLIQNISFTVSPGEVLTLMGPSGAGKSTFLSWMIGALPVEFSVTGELWLNQQRRDTLPTARRNIGILFQDALLFAHLNVGQNLAMALPAIIKGREQRQYYVEQALANAQLTNFSRRDPATLSGGERARVSVLRALLAKPEALLLDEPFSRLDQTLREQFRQFVWQQVEQQAIPVVLVTHDPQDIPTGGHIITVNDSGY
ncbi:ATP-binding cassette domain-containing protein [Buttiauxella sp. S04-F03]|uniref:ATP-binding cassette domain-containing protein n=1 Tax=Buttiauxella sp. S04-F03 TaxID=2904525 RepID=UPI001E57C26C|nr:ATP-binding cassette domain-containing protein [Buttiauxella sp. S04-F03]MCE0812877.1 ATP-binding cassette domain-containing protein [Buttiauxella sp. S04-F03]